MNVVLYLKDTEQVTFLEYALLSANINYKVEKADGKWGIPPPYLEVSGAPLDEKRAFMWISEQIN